MTAARAAAFVAALSAASCGAPMMKLPAGPGAPASDGAALLAQVTATCSKISTLSAEVGVAGAVNGQRVRGRLLAGLAAPDSLYMEAPAPFGAPIFVLGASKGDATLLLPRDRRVLEHGQPDAVLSAITGVPLGPAELKSTLTGCADGGAAGTGDARAFGADWRVISGKRSVSYVRREGSSEPWRLVSVLRTGPDGWRADYSNFLNDLPRSIRIIASEARRFDLRLTLSQVDVNVELAASTFQVSIPENTRPISLDELRAGGPLAR